MTQAIGWAEAERSSQSVVPGRRRSMALPRRRPTALVVDDVAFIRRLIGAALEKDGFAIEEAASAHEAGRALRRGAFDVVLLDVDLGGTATGYDLLGEVRRDPRLEGLPVILVTGTSCDPHAVARGLLAGATDHIAKPFDAVVLRARVASARRSQAVLGAVRARAATTSREAQTFRSELDDAMRVQRASLPRVPLASAGLLVTGETVAARRVSGDTFDVVADGEGRTAVFLLDVAGHGVASGLVLSACRAAVRRALELGKPMDAVVSAIQSCLLTLGDVLEAAVAVGILRFSEADATVEVLNAGLPPLVMARAAGGLICYPSRSAPVGLLRGGQHPGEAHQRAPGDVWMLASDGLTSGTLDDDEACALAARIGLPCHGARLAAADPDDLRALILEWASCTQREAADDMTLVIVGDDRQAGGAR